MQPFKPGYIAELLNDQQRYSSENLLTWYSLSGGVPKYLEWLSRHWNIVGRRLSSRPAIHPIYL